MSSYDRKTQYFTKKKSRALGERENFLQMYDRTCNKIYFYSYDVCQNCHDADLIMRDSYIYMYEHIGELRKSKNLDVWQKECVDKAFRQLLRSQLLTLVHDDTYVSATTTLSETKKEELWNSIIKMADLDPWRMVPVPGKSSLFSVLADQTISDLRYMSVLDIVKSAALILFAIAAFAAAIYFGIDYIKDKQESKINATEEIFLDERYYDDFDLTTSDKVEDEMVDAYYTAAMKKERDEEGNLLSYTYPAAIGDTAGSAQYTDDLEINETLIEIIKETINDDMSDFQKIEALYQYVGKNMEYREYEGSGKDVDSILRDCFEYNAGTSQHYAVLLDALYEAAGYRCTVIEGSFVLNRDTEFERSVRHYWNRISLGGIVYYLDLEADCNADGTEVRNYYFMAASGNARWEIFERDHID